MQIESDVRIQTIERLIAEQEIEAARNTLRDYLYDRLEGHRHAGSIADAISALATDAGHHQDTAAYLVRCLAVPNLLPPSNPTNLLSVHLVTLCERALPSLCRFLELDRVRQTHEKLAILTTVHAKACDILSPLLDVPDNLADFVSSRQRVLHALNHSLITTYCRPFNLPSASLGVVTIFSGLTRLLREETDVKSILDDFEHTLAQQFIYCAAHFSFFSDHFLLRFLGTADSTVKRYVEKTRSRFVTLIQCRVGANNTLQKRYPLRQGGRIIPISVPLRSTGPGTAIGATASFETDSQDILIDEAFLALGNISPGDFSVIFHIMIDAACDQFTFMTTITWNEVGQVDRRESVFVINIASQRSGIDWASLVYRKPYSTEVAKGNEFVGRSEKVTALAGNLLRTPMDSFYVTGQKRVGKTSLALAVLDFAKKHGKGSGLESLYLLWGAIAHEDPRVSLKVLGGRIANFISNTFPLEQERISYNFDGSLAALMPLAETAYTIDKSRRYVIVIDEFDEIHPELYISGNLAETFFANIRAINTCDNVCIILVGGENMPFIMERQGQKLNKFIRVTLDYFSRDEEWEDYKLLLRRPTEGVFHWHDEAIADVFNVTNGNPYYTKILCAKVYANAVKERDSDITSGEVKRAIASEIGAFDTNSFVHLWQDGIYKAPGSRDPDILRRCRVLVAMARTARKGQEMTLENVLSNKHSVGLSDSEVQPVLNDYTRRDVLAEAEGQYHFVLPIFEMWLVEVGINRLSSDLSDELARDIQAAEDAAYIHSGEIVELSRKWPTYRGRLIGSEEIRAWCEQVDGHRHQRLLFKLLQHVTLYGESQIREKLKMAHLSFVRPLLPAFVVRKRSERRMDVLVTYVDGEGKSGQFYASRYAEENGISTKAIVPQRDLASSIKALKDRQVDVAAIVIVDDIIATGESLTRNLDSLIADNHLIGSGVTIVIVVLTATVEGEARVRAKLLESEGVQVDRRICDILKDSQFAFSGQALWTDREEMERAKSLCVDIGVSIYRDNPLGYGGQGLLVVFPESCPNNSLPILHSRARPNTGRSWTPLFPRITN